jgi:hypothetical protein
VIAKEKAFNHEEHKVHKGFLGRKVFKWKIEKEGGGYVSD